MNSLYQHPPYKDLYIYYINGRLPQDDIPDDTAFIGQWEEEQDSFLFFSRSSDALVSDVLAKHSHLIVYDQFQMTYEQWQGGALSPIQIGDLRILPAWLATSEDLDNGSLLLDPGVVFGAGTHPTTRDCLAAVQSAFALQTVDNLVDLGTGTGLLALAAVRCGARRCVAVDLNRLAVETALRNVRLNKMLDRILVVQGDAKNFIDLSCDLMVSNIHYDVMRHIVAAPGFQMTKQFVLSGLLRSQAREIEHRVLHGGAKILRKWDREGIWYTFHGINSPRYP